jgi:hypothetical protein
LSQKKIDLDNLPIIDDSDVPERSRRYNPYREMFKRINKGQALKLDPDKLPVNIGTARATLRKFQKNGEFKHLVAEQRTIGDKKILYVRYPETDE